MLLCHGEVLAMEASGSWLGNQVAVAKAGSAVVNVHLYWMNSLTALSNQETSCKTKESLLLYLSFRATQPDR